jgi:hypothetical protein
MSCVSLDTMRDEARCTCPAPQVIPIRMRRLWIRWPSHVDIRIHRLSPCSLLKNRLGQLFQWLSPQKLLSSDPVIHRLANS